MRKKQRRPKSVEKPWKEFELAVHAFLKTLLKDTRMRPSRLTRVERTAIRR